MIITRARLIDVARREAEARGASGDVLSAYLVGSVVGGEPLLGGTADIDLVLIHEGDPPSAREMVPLSAEIHLDIVHHPRALYAQPRSLRLDPWLGPAISEPVFLYDPQHFVSRCRRGRADPSPARRPQSAAARHRPDQRPGSRHAFLAHAGQNLGPVRRAQGRLEIAHTADDTGFMQLFRLNPDGTGEYDNLVTNNPAKLLELMAAFAQWEAQTTEPLWGQGAVPTINNPFVDSSNLGWLLDSQTSTYGYALVKLRERINWDADFTLKVKMETDAAGTRTSQWTLRRSGPGS